MSRDMCEHGFDTRPRPMACAECLVALEPDEAVEEIKRLREALTVIACFDEGPEVNGSFDEPGSALVARDALGGR